MQRILRSAPVPRRRPKRGDRATGRQGTSGSGRWCLARTGRLKQGADDGERALLPAWLGRSTGEEEGGTERGATAQRGRWPKKEKAPSTRGIASSGTPAARTRATTQPAAGGRCCVPAAVSLQRLGTQRARGFWLPARRPAYGARITYRRMSCVVVLASRAPCLHIVLWFAWPEKASPTGRPGTRSMERKAEHASSCTGTDRASRWFLFEPRRARTGETVAIRATPACKHPVSSLVFLHLRVSIFVFVSLTGRMSRPSGAPRRLPNTRAAAPSACAVWRTIAARRLAQTGRSAMSNAFAPLSANGRGERARTPYVHSSWAGCLFSVTKCRPGRGMAGRLAGPATFCSRSSLGKCARPAGALVRDRSGGAGGS